jgi:hypothetical protein
MFTAIPLMPNRAGLGFISTFESRGNSLGFRLFKHFNYHRVDALFVGHFYSFSMRYWTRNSPFSILSHAKGHVNHYLQHNHKRF